MSHLRTFARVTSFRQRPFGHSQPRRALLASCGATSRVARIGFYRRLVGSSAQLSSMPRTIGWLQSRPQPSTNISAFIRGYMNHGTENLGEVRNGDARSSDILASLARSIQLHSVELDVIHSRADFVTLSVRNQLPMLVWPMSCAGTRKQSRAISSLGVIECLALGHLVSS